MDYYIAIDQGTHATRALLYDQNGNQVESKWTKVDLRRVKDGWIEQDSQELLDSVLDTVQRLLDSLTNEQRSSVRAAGIATQRSSVLLMDQNGNAVSPILSWQDVRAADFLKRIKHQHQVITSITGLPVSAHYGASKLRWLVDQHKPDKNNIMLAPLVSYYLFHLLGKKRFCVDHSNAQRTQLFDLDTLDWSPELLKLYELEGYRLPECLPMAADYGELFDTGIPFMASGGDQNAAVHGAGRLPDDTSLMNLGSGAFVMRPMQQRQTGNGLLSSVAYSDKESASYLREGTVNGSGTALSWATKEWDLPDTREHISDWCEEVTNPPVFINSVGGLGSPWWRRDIEPQLLKTETVSKSAKGVAVAESILFLLNTNLELMRREQPINRLRLSGGLSQQNALCQKLSNLTGLPLERVDNPEATARGIAWIAAGRPDGWQKIDMDTFSPQPDEGIGQRYWRAFNYLRTLPPAAGSVPALVGHRGVIANYPENTLSSIAAAIGAGAPHVEFDLQMASDGEFVVIHDDTTDRTCEEQVSVFSKTSNELQQISAHYPDKFKQSFLPEPIPLLSEVLEYLSAHPQVTAYVEIKEESMTRFGLERVMAKLIEVLKDHAAPFYVISFSYEAIHYVHKHSQFKTSWVVKKYNERYRSMAEELQPDGLICNYKKVADQPLWPGYWWWMLYDIKEPKLAMKYHQIGADLIETADMPNMLMDKDLYKGRLHGL